MSRKATNEYIGIKRRAYAQAGRAKRMRILDDVCETTGYERKYANRLLTGSRKFREHRGRGKTYGDDVTEVLKRVWREAGCPCLPYFKAEVGRWVEEYATQVAHIRPEVKEQLIAMSDRTMSRRLSGEARVKPGWAKGNKRSGRGAHNEVKNNTPCASGEVIMACNVPPGDAQIDTFALGGGDPSERSGSTARRCRTNSSSSATTGRTFATSSARARCSCRRKSTRTARASSAHTTSREPRTRGCWTNTCSRRSRKPR